MSIYNQCFTATGRTPTALTPVLTHKSHTLEQENFVGTKFHEKLKFAPELNFMSFNFMTSCQ